MKQSAAILLTAVGALFLSNTGPKAQQAATPAPGASPPATSALVRPGPGGAAIVSCPPASKVCVREPKHNTRRVYGCKIEEYCLPRCSLLSLFQGKCDCDQDGCGDVRVRHRLVVKKVEDR